MITPIRQIFTFNTFAGLSGKQSARPRRISESPITNSLMGSTNGKLIHRRGRHSNASGQHPIWTEVDFREPASYESLLENDPPTLSGIINVRPRMSIKSKILTILFTAGTVITRGAAPTPMPADGIIAAIDAHGLRKAIREQILHALQEIFTKADLACTRSAGEFEISPGLFFHTFSYSFVRVREEISFRREEAWNTHFEHVIDLITSANTKMGPFSTARNFMFSKDAKAPAPYEMPSLSYTVWFSAKIPNVLLANVDLVFVDQGGGLVTVMGSIISRRIGEDGAKP